MVEQVEEYVRKNYKRKYGDKPLTIDIKGTHIEVKSNKDESPLILSLTII